VVAPYPPPALAPAAPVAAPAAKKGGGILKVILIVIAVLILLSLLSVGGCAYYYYFHIKPAVNQAQKQIQAGLSRMGTREVHTQPMAPSETPTPGAAPVADISTLTYPGATASETASQIFPGMKMQEYTTSDSVETVTAYYKNKLGSNATVMQSGGNSVVQMAGSNGLISITIAPDQSSGKTKITVSSIGK
jgi:hypothetical protein